MDDILSGGHSIEEAKLKQSQLIKALASAEFPLNKLTTNNICLLENCAREDLLNEEFLKIKDYSSLKTLGIRWNAMTDSFYYTIVPIEVSPHTTKIIILSAIAKLFDPLWLVRAYDNHRKNINARFVGRKVWLG